MEAFNNFKETHDECTLLYIILSFTIGVIVGIIMSPVKKGIAIGSYNGADNKFVNSNNIEKKQKNKKRSNLK